MCDTCGCGNPTVVRETKTVEVKKSLLEENERIANSNKRHFEKSGTIAINLISSPGSGKTTLLEKTIDALKDFVDIGVLEGDIETERDAERIRKKGVPAIQLTTGGACHLEASLVHKGIHALEHANGGKLPRLLFIENVGNLVCPASFYLGETVRVVLVSVPEGDDKPAKYPKAFKTSQVFLITKIDLLPYFDFDVEKVKKEALSINPALKVFEVSARTGEGLEDWLDYLRNLVAS
jgi:hydrogenase nickel incorporation protein HypB